MTLRYPAATLLLAAGGAFMIVATYVFAYDVTIAISLAISIGAAAVSLLTLFSSLPDDGRSVHGVLLLFSGLVGAWTIIVTAVGIGSSGTTSDLIVASGIAIAGAGFLAHALNDVILERRLTAAERTPAVQA